MIQVQTSAPLIKKILREQVYNQAENYRWATYVYKVAHKDGSLVYNVLTKELLLLSDSQNEEEQLVKKWFLVKSSFVEKGLIEQIKSFLSIISLRNNTIDNYTIFTTTDCNARCYYCFEKDSPKIRMNNDVITQTVDFIRHYYKNKNILIQWFGGEPLYNIKAINRISEELNAHNISFSSSMTSNGYLFNENILVKAIKEWHLKSIQITLDGTKENYNRIKSYIHKDPNPYMRVMDNIEQLLKSKIDTTVRLNISLDNFADIKILLYQLIERFKDYDNLTIYAHPLFDLMTDTASRKEILMNLSCLQEIINNHHFNQEYTYFARPRITHCKADNNSNSIVIYPDGNIGLCDHKFGEEYIGHVSNTQLNSNIIQKWRTVKESISQCATCLLYPDCIKLEYCDTNANCYPELIEIDKKLIERSIISSYQKYMSKNETEI